jgi:hypothetical protein
MERMIAWSPKDSFSHHRLSGYPPSSPGIFRKILVEAVFDQYSVSFSTCHQTVNINRNPFARENSFNLGIFILHAKE